LPPSAAFRTCVDGTLRISMDVVDQSVKMIVRVWELQENEPPPSVVLSIPEQVPKITDILLRRHPHQSQGISYHYQPAINAPL